MKMANTLSKKAEKKDAEDMEVFMEQFGNAIQLAANIYCIHREERGDSWDSMSVKDLAERLFDEFGEWVKEYNAGHEVRQVAEAADVVNFWLMFIEAMGTSRMAVARTRVLEKANVKELERRQRGNSRD